MKKTACPTNKETSAPVKTRVERTRDEVLDEVRCVEDQLLRLITMFESGTLSQQSASYGFREIWLKLKRMSDMDEDKPERTIK